jgi:phenylalanyl-tRNA synthetase beta chain
MKLSLDWLKDYVKFKKTPEQLAEGLTSAGFEVERIDTFGQGFEQVIVGQIKTIVNHADADKLGV